MFMRKAMGAVALGLAALTLAGCSSTKAPMRSQVQSWTKQVGLPPIDQQIEVDLQYLKAATTAAQLAQLQTNCNGFPGDVEALYETLPTPDQKLTNEFNNATQDWEAAARSCVDAKTVKSTDYAKYVKNLAAGNKAYAAAKSQLKTFGAQ